MTKDELRQLCQAKWGRFWQAELSRQTGISRRTIRRYAAGDSKISKPVEKLIRFLLK